MEPLEVFSGAALSSRFKPPTGPYQTWTKYLHLVVTEMGWTFPQAEEHLSCGHAWFRKLMRGDSTDSSYREAVVMRLTAKWEESRKLHPSRPPLRWPLYVELEKRAVSAPLPEKTRLDYSKYAQAILERYGRVPLDLLNVIDGKYQELSFLKIYTPPNVRSCQEFFPQSLERTKEQYRQTSHYSTTAEEVDFPHAFQKQPLLSAVDVLEDSENSRVVILGELGAGKSSLIHYLALRWAESTDEVRQGLPVPIILELKWYAQARRNGENVHDFLDFLDHGAGVFWRIPRQDLEEILSTGRARIFFDGLDEVMDASVQQEVLTSISRFAGEYPLVRVVTTSRLVGYSVDTLRRAQFQHFLLQDFEDDQISQFIDAWYRECQSKQRAGYGTSKAQLLKQTIAASSDLRELAGTPILLAILAVLNLHGDIPSSRVELLQKCSEMLLKCWKVEEALRADPDLSEDATVVGLSEKRTILQHLAREMTRKSNDNIYERSANAIELKELENCIARSVTSSVHCHPLKVARAMIRQLRERNGILCWSGGDHYAFVHRAFLDYFFACDLQELFIVGQISEEDLKDIFFKQWDAPGRQDALCLFCTLVEPSFVEWLLCRLLGQIEEQSNHLFTKCHFFVARCLKELKQLKRSPLLLGRVKAKLIETSCLQPPAGEPFPDFPPDVPHEIVDFIKTNLNDQYHEVVNEVEDNAEHSVEWMGILFSGAVDVAEQLQRLIEFGALRKVRIAAVRSFSKGWESQEDTWKWLIRNARQSQFSDVRETALEELALRWREHPSTLEFLKVRAVSEIDRNVRKTAVQEIAKHWKMDSCALAWLKELIVSHENTELHRVAVRGIARNFSPAASVLEWLKGLVQSRRYPDIAATAIEEIAANWKNETGLVDWLRKIIRTNKNPDTRVSATTALREHWGNNPEILLLFRNLACNDDDEDVRQQSLCGLVDCGASKEETLDLLKAIARSDPSWYVRKVAVSYFLRHRSDDPETLQILQDSLSGASARGLFSMALEIPCACRHYDEIMAILHGASGNTVSDIWNADDLLPPPPIQNRPEE